MKPLTLSRKLFVRIAPTILITILMVGALAFHSADTEINREYDAQLTSNANVLWMLISDEMKEIADHPRKVEDIDLPSNNPFAPENIDDIYADSRMFRVWQAGKLMMYSDTALPAIIPQQANGFSNVTYHDEVWRVYSLPIAGKPVSIEVGEKVALRDALVGKILFNLAVPLLLLVPIVAGLLWFGIKNSLGVIHTLVEQIRTRSPDDLSHVEIQHLPYDLLPLGKSLNQLFTKLQHSFAAEKRFTDHAAHQLRTPLATLKLQLQMLANASSEDEKRTLLAELIQSNERAAKLVSMLLTSSRLHYQPIELRPIPIYPVLASAMADLGMLATQKKIEMSLEGDEEACVLAEEILLKLMLSNIIENAIKYTPENGQVRVHILPAGQEWKIVVQDTGCGIALQERALVFERFYRVSTPNVEGSGLGLAIVAEIIQRFSGQIHLLTPPSGVGLQVEVTLRAC